MKVFVVINWDIETTESIFSTKVKAEIYINKQSEPKYYDIEEYTIDIEE